MEKRKLEALLCLVTRGGLGLVVRSRGPLVAVAAAGGPRSCGEDDRVGWLGWLKKGNGME